MKGLYGPVAAFFLIQLLAMLAAASLSTKPYVSEFRPEIVSETPRTSDILSIVNLVIIGTVVLVILKFIGFRMRYMVDMAVLVSSYYLAGIVTNMFLPSLLFALLILVLRGRDSLLLYNASSGVSIVAFSLLFGLFLNPDLVILLMAVMSIYDVIGVLYTRHIKYIWFGMTKKLLEFNPGWRDMIAVIFPQEKQGYVMIGAGDFALPALLTVNLATSSFLAGGISLLLSTAGFFTLQKLASMTTKSSETGLPGIPVLAFFSAIALLLARAAGLAG